MRLSLLSLALLAGCATGHAQVAEGSNDPAIADAEASVTAAREARDTAIRFLEVATAQDEAAQSQLRAQAINASTDLRAVAGQTKREYARQLVLLRDSQLQLAKDRLRAARGDRVGDKLARDQQKVAARQADVDRLRMSWDSERRAADYAKAEMPNAAPPHLEPITPPATGANEGPSEGFQQLPQQIPPP